MNMNVENRREKNDYICNEKMIMKQWITMLKIQSFNTPKNIYISKKINK